MLLYVYSVNVFLGIEALSERESLGTSFKVKIRLL
jgi:hypothetical protein